MNLIREIDFRHECILIFLKEREFIYNTYDIMLLLSVNYETIKSLFEDLLFFEMIINDEEIKKYKITYKGVDLLKSKLLDNFDLDSFLNIKSAELIDEVESKLLKENIMYIPCDFKI